MTARQAAQAGRESRGLVPKPSVTVFATRRSPAARTVKSTGAPLKRQLDKSRAGETPSEDCSVSEPGDVISTRLPPQEARRSVPTARLYFDRPPTCRFERFAARLQNRRPSVRSHWRKSRYWRY